MSGIESFPVIASGLGVSRNPADYLPLLLFAGTIVATVIVYKKLSKLGSSNKKVSSTVSDSLSDYEKKAPRNSRSN